MVNLKMVEPTDHGHDGGIPPPLLSLKVFTSSRLLCHYPGISLTQITRSEGLRGEETQTDRMLLSLSLDVHLVNNAPHFQSTFGYR